MYIFSSGNKNIMVSHGDSFCIDDKQYQSLKNEIRSSEWINDFLSKPLEERVQIANESERKAQRKAAISLKTLWMLTKNIFQKSSKKIILIF